MLGNDFLPNVPAIEIAHDGVGILYKYYVECRKSSGFLCNDDIQLNPTSIVELFRIMAEVEPALLVKKWKKSKSQWPDTVLNDAVRNDSGGGIDMESYKKAYYERNFGEGIDIDRVCEEYVRGCSFVLQYYAVEIPTFDWYYPYHYAPLFCDLYEWCKKQETLDFKFKFKKALSLTEALVSVLPPSSFHLLPEPLQTQMRAQALIDEDFPDDFKIDLEGKIMDYEGVCLLPMIPYDKVKALCKKYKKKDPEGKLIVI